jgi:hypothetical protein
MCHLVDLNPTLVLKVIERMASLATRPAESTEDLLEKFANRYDLPQMADHLFGHLP